MESYHYYIIMIVANLLKSCLLDLTFRKIILRQSRQTQYYIWLDITLTGLTDRFLL